MIATVAAHPLAFAALPVLGAVIGALTVRFAVLTLVARVGPRPVAQAHADRIAAAFARLVDGDLLTAQELLSRLDPDAMVGRIEAPLRTFADQTTVELMQRHKPDLWELLPLRVKQSVIHQVRAGAPELVVAVLTALEAHADEVLDLGHLVRTALRGRLVALLRATLVPLLRPATWRAAVTGLVLGAAAVPASAALTGAPLPLPYLAPLPVAVLAAAAGLVPVAWPAAHSAVHRHRERTGRALAEFLAARVLTFPTVIGELTGGPHNDTVRELVRRGTVDAIDARASVAKPLVSAALGGRQYQELKYGAADAALDGAGNLTRHLRRYAEDSMAVRGSVAHRYRRLAPDVRARPVRVVLRATAARVTVTAVVLGLLGCAAQWALTLTAGG